jgi:hypothetical protein
VTALCALFQTEMAAHDWIMWVIVKRLFNSKYIHIALMGGFRALKWIIFRQQIVEVIETEMYNKKVME